VEGVSRHRRYILFFKNLRACARIGAHRFEYRHCLTLGSALFFFFRRGGGGGLAAPPLQQVPAMGLLRVCVCVCVCASRGAPTASAVYLSSDCSVCTCYNICVLILLCMRARTGYQYEDTYIVYIHLSLGLSKQAAPTASAFYALTYADVCGDACCRMLLYADV
jgi:hypothetical protein